MELFVLNVLNGISFGAILFLLGAGLSLIFGVMGILNLAHGAIYMVGAYIGWTIAIQQGCNFGLAVLAGGVAAGILGLIMERGFLRRLHHMLNQQVLLTFGFVYVLTNLCLWIWEALPKAPFTAPALAWSFPIMSGTYSTARITIAAIGIALAIGLWWLQDKTRLGAIVRAGMDDKVMINALGINYGIVATAIFFLGCFIAGAAGVLGAHLFGVNLELGIEVLLLAVVVVVVGGTGSVQGALVGGILIGLIISFGKALFPELSMFFVYLIMVIILLIKPSGLLGKPIRRW
jgi:branched-chain amino acid transport system permease protein